jgi:hypothetical protein
MHGSRNGWRKVATNLTYFLFNKILRVERKDDLHKEVEDINESVKQKTLMLEKVEKCLIRHPILL